MKDENSVKNDDNGQSGAVKHGTGDNDDRGAKNKIPRRYGLYDRAFGNLSLKVVDTIIYALVGLLVIALFIGIFGK